MDNYILPMILFREEDYLPHKEKFTLNATHENTWREFAGQYGNLLRLLNETALKLQYQLNSKSYPYLFLLRHYCELKLKEVLEARGIKTPKSHDFADIFPLLPDLPADLKNAIREVNLDSDGSCYRYFYNKNGDVGILYGLSKDFTPFYDKLSGVSSGSTFDLNLRVAPPFSGRKAYEFTFHFNEVHSSGVFRSYYDELTRFVLNEITNERIEVNSIYLPLLYMIRHSFELALKDGLLGIIHTQSNEAHRKITRLLNNEHKLSKLFACYINVIPEDKISLLPIELQQQYVKYKSQTDRLKESIHLLDANSRYFKYPFDAKTEHLNIEKDTLKEIITLFLEVDAFLTFNVDILKEYQVIAYSEEEVARMMGYDPEYY